MYAIVEIKKKQYKVSEGETIRVDRMLNEPGESLEFDSVMLLAEEKEVHVGTPFVEGAKVRMTVKEEFRDKKVRVVKFKRRKGYERTHGHRQTYTLLSVDQITL